MSELAFSTARLDMIASSVDHLCAEQEAYEDLGAMLGVEVPEGWPPGEYDQAAITFLLEWMAQGGPEAEGWYGWYAILRAEPGAEGATRGVLVGSTGYFGPPDPDGVVQIGYSVVESYRGRGLATEMVAGMTARALAMPGVTSIVAETDEQNIASCKVLERNGFERVGAGRDPGHVRYRFGGVSSPV